MTENWRDTLDGGGASNLDQLKIMKKFVRWPNNKCMR